MSVTPREQYYRGLISSAEFLQSSGLEVVTAEGIGVGDYLVATGPKAGLRDVFYVEYVREPNPEYTAFRADTQTEYLNEFRQNVVLNVEGDHGQKDSWEISGDTLVVRVKS